MRPARAPASPLSASTSRRCRNRCSKPSSSASRRAPTPAPSARAATASSRRPTAAPCCSTRSATCRWRCRASCCACCRSRKSSRWAATRCSASTCASSPPPAATCRRWSRRAASAPTCTTGSTCCRSACRRCASASTTWRRWSRRWPRTSRGAAGWPHKSLNADALDLLARHDWPGNIRELRNVLEQATLMTDDPSLGAGHFGALAAALAPAATGRGRPWRPSRCSALGRRPAAWVPLPQAVAELEARRHPASAAAHRRQQAGGRAAARHLAGHAVPEAGAGNAQ